jgi:hypothetical protein
LSYPRLSVCGVDEVWQTLERVLDECLAEAVFAKPESMVVDELDRLMVAAQKVAAATLARVREVDGRGLAVGAGATSTLAWLRDRYRMSGGAASQLVKLARALDADADSPTAAALAVGRVNVEQAKVITDAVAKLPVEHRKAGEEHLVGEAETFGPRELGRLGQRIFEVVAPDEADKHALDALERAERRAWQERGLWLTDIPGTSEVRVTGRLTQDDAATVRAVLGPLCAPRAMRRTGDDPDPADRRSAGERCADAFIEVCRLAGRVWRVARQRRRPAPGRGDHRRREPAPTGRRRQVRRRLPAVPGGRAAVGLRRRDHPGRARHREPGPRRRPAEPPGHRPAAPGARVAG